MWGIMNINTTLDQWTSPIDPCEFVKAVMGEQLDRPIDHYSPDKIDKAIERVYGKIHKFIKKNQKSFNSDDAELIAKLAERVTSLGLYINHKDPGVEKIFALAKDLRVPSKKEIETIPLVIRSLIYDYAVSPKEEFRKDFEHDFNKFFKSKFHLYNDETSTSLSNFIYKYFNPNMEKDRLEVYIQELCIIIDTAPITDKLKDHFFGEFVDTLDLKLFMNINEEPLWTSMIKYLIFLAPPKPTQKHYVYRCMAALSPSTNLYPLSQQKKDLAQQFKEKFKDIIPADNCVVFPFLKFLMLF